MSQKTAREIKKEMVEKLGEDFGSLLYSLHNEIIWLTFRWTEFKELYGTKETRIELMNETAPLLFYMIQKVFWENLLVGVCRITDPPKTSGKKNMTIRSLPNFLTDRDFKIQIESEINTLLVESEFCRDWRNRWIAHADFDLTTEQHHAKPLAPATRKQLKEVIERIHSIYNKIELRYLKTTTVFGYLKSGRGAIALLHKIESGARFDKAEYEQKLSGKWSQDSFISKV